MGRSSSPKRSRPKLRPATASTHVSGVVDAVAWLDRPPSNCCTRAFDLCRKDMRKPSLVPPTCKVATLLGEILLPAPSHASEYPKMWMRATLCNHPCQLRK